MRINVKHVSAGDDRKCPGLGGGDEYNRISGGCWGDTTKYEGFTFIGEMEWANESYSFDMTGVWQRDSDLTLWTADDTGCSCPAPWDMTHQFERLFNEQPLIDRFNKERAEYAKLDSKYEPGPRMEDWTAFMARVSAAFVRLRTNDPNF